MITTRLPERNPEGIEHHNNKKTSEDNSEEKNKSEGLNGHCCEESCRFPTDFVCQKCGHHVCPQDSVGSLHDQSIRVCGHCLTHVKESDGKFVELE